MPDDQTAAAPATDTAAPAPMPGLTPGRVAHYVCPRPDWPHFAAMIVGVGDPVAGVVNLTVFTPMGYTRPEIDIPHDPTGTTAGTWHFPERA